jgi:hypothetical protein
MAIKQISVFLENKPGTLKEMTKVLANAGVDMNALSLAETKDFGIVRIIVDDVYETANVLRESGFVCSMTPVVGVMIPDVVGGLDRVLEILSAADINLEYMYASLGGKKQNDAYMILRVENCEKAESALRAGGIYVLSQENASDM